MKDKILHQYKTSGRITVQHSQVPFNLYCPDLILPLQRKASQYLLSWHLCVVFSTVRDMQVTYLSCVTNVW